MVKAFYYIEETGETKDGLTLEEQKIFRTKLWQSLLEIPLKEVKYESITTSL